MPESTRPQAAPEHTLPVRANLEHLRKEAKLLLRQLRLQQPGAKLTAAQREVARRYGFTSWRRLKAHVDVLNSSRRELVAAISAGDVAVIRGILDRTPAMVDASADLEEHLIRPSDAKTMRLVHLAIAANQEPALRLLIEYGANLNVRNHDGRLPLHDCFELGRDHLGDLLLAAGAIPDACAAAAFGWLDRLREILRRDPESANDLQTGIPPLGWCVYGDRLDCAEILLAGGALLTRPPFDAEAWAPTAHVANTRFAALFLAHGLDPNCRGRQGNTPLHAAISSRLVRDPAPFVQMLLAAGAAPSIQNEQGRTPLDQALLEVGRYAEAYFPPRPIAVKKMDGTIALLRKRLKMIED